MNLELFAPREDDAIERANHFFDVDPFPSVPPALLSSAEIRDYARVTGMLFPFNDIEDASIKSASYGAKIVGQRILWAPIGNEIQKQDLARDPNCRFPANSISFVEIEPTFRLPMYMAIRFNLAITHVHRGLLLGTGPLVDPGFWGRILIPIHNLTDSEYTVAAGDNLVWIEFTKTTFSSGRSSGSAFPYRQAKAVAFPKRKKQRPAEWYLYAAGHGMPIRSSIPGAVTISQRSALEAAESAAAIRDRITFAGIIGAMALGAAALGIYIQTHSLVQDAHSLSQSAVVSVTTAVNEAKSSVETLEKKIASMEGQQERDKKDLAKLFAELNTTLAKLNALQIEMERLRGLTR